MEKCIIWSSIQVLPNQVSKKSFCSFEDIDLRESHAKLHKTPCIMCVQYIGGCSVHRGEFSTLGRYHEYIRGYHEYIRGYHEYIGDVQYIGGIP